MKKSEYFKKKRNIILTELAFLLAVNGYAMYDINKRANDGVNRASDAVDINRATKGEYNETIVKLNDDMWNSYYDSISGEPLIASALSACSLVISGGKVIDIIREEKKNKKLELNGGNYGK